MNPELLRKYFDKHQVSRRDAMKLAGTAGAAGAAAWAGLSASGTAGAAERPAERPKKDDYSDEWFDYSDPDNLSDWAPSRYGADDQRGTFNEVDSAKTAAALGLLKRHLPVRTYNMGELMFNGFPAFKTDPPRTLEQRLSISGYPVPPNFRDEGGIVTSEEPLAENKVSIHEERFLGKKYEIHPEPTSTTYQIATQVDNLNHLGADDYFYNGNRGRDIAKGWGTTKLGNEHMGPIVTRGVLLDILGVKIANGDDGDLAEPASNGKPLLKENYRITLEDIKAAMDMGGIDEILPGDVVLFRTGWNQLLAERDPKDIERWEASKGLPGPYLREARWLGERRPAIVGSDSWALEVVGNDVNNDGSAFPVHQELLMRYGVRIGESMVSDGLADDEVYEFVYIVTPQYAEGATAGNTPPAALAQPRGL
ncbi:MAG: cyclase family protein [Streptosporangiales bacterium]|nr:cyclase family protein [Streptosporangiales bacterium]